MRLAERIRLDESSTLCKVWKMNREPPLKPTLWRTCRVLANHTQLRIFGELVREAPQTVSGVARSLQLSLPVVSQALRALEARGLLAARREGRRTHYRLSNMSTGAAQELMRALRSAFRRRPVPVKSLFRLSTAFTHPRRIEIFRAAHGHAFTLRQIRTATGISMPALLRHLEKLQTRGFVACRGGSYSATNPAEAFGRALARLAAQ